MQKLARLKPYKSSSPMETVQKIRQILFDNDIFVIETAQKVEPITGVCSCRIILGDEGLRELNIGSNGKGMNARYALASAYAEFMERLQNGALLWKILGVPKNAPNSEQADDPTLKKAVYSLMRLAYGQGQDVEKAAAQVLFATDSHQIITMNEYLSDEQLSVPVGVLNKMTGSNGMAAGNTVLEATIQGLSEVFERTAIQKLFLEKITPPVIEEHLFEGTDVLNRLHRLQKKNISYKILDCSLGEGLPVIGLLLEKDKKYHIHFGADPSAITALERCLTESFQGRTIEELPLYLPLEDTDDLRVLFLNEKKEYSDSTGQVPIWLINGSATYPFKGFYHPVSVSDEDDMKYYLEILMRMGKKLYLRDTGVLGFPTVRLYVPGITENHCPLPSFCAETNCPASIEKKLKRMPLLTDEEYADLADDMQNWMCDGFSVQLPEEYPAGEYANIKYLLPAGRFPARYWDDRLIIAAIYSRGGKKVLGNAILERHIQENCISPNEADVLRLRINSRSLMFTAAEWPQCPDCNSCYASRLCHQKSVATFADKLGKNILKMGTDKQETL